MNIIQIAGHLGADPETRVTAGGLKVTTLRIATNTRSGDKEETIWWRVTIWGNEFDNMIKHLKKGSAVIVVGEMHKAPEIYTDRNGKQQVSLQITARMLKFSPFGGKQQDRSQQQQPQQAAPAAYSQQYTGHQTEHDFSATNTFGSNAGGYVATGLGSFAEDLDEEGPPF